MEINDGIGRISASYGLKVPTDVPYSSQDGHISMSVEFPVSGDTETVMNLFQQERVKLMANVKLAVFGELGVEFSEDQQGVLSPNLTAKAPQAAAPAPAPAPVAAPAPQQSGGGNKYGPPKVDYTTLPRFTVTLGDGRQVTLLDMRGPKLDGTYKPTAADFKVDGEQKSFWINNKDGSPNTETRNWLASQGIQV